MTGHERDELGRIVLRRHADVAAVASDAVTFSSAVSAHLQVPNGLDGDEHAAMRRMLAPLFVPDRMAELEPGLRAIAQDLVDQLAEDGAFDAVGDLGARYSVRAQSLRLGWPGELEEELLAWVAENRAATLSGDRGRMSEVAAGFDAIVQRLITVRRALPAQADPDVTTRLMRAHLGEGRSLGDAELVSILRNFTGGDLSTLALCTGVVAHWLASDPEEQEGLAAGDDAALAAAVDEMLRIDDPFVSNRRRALADTEVGGCPVTAGEVVLLNWPSANRDPEVFADPDGFDPVGHAADNLVYGLGAHVCPGRPLATVELVVLTRTLLERGRVRLAPGQSPQRESPPAGGWRLAARSGCARTAVSRPFGRRRVSCGSHPGRRRRGTV